MPVGIPEPHSRQESGRARSHSGCVAVDVAPASLSCAWCDFDFARNRQAALEGLVGHLDEKFPSAARQVAIFAERKIRTIGYVVVGDIVDTAREGPGF
jgi:hypothetical protein